MVSSTNLDSNWLFDSLKQFPAQSEIKTWWLAYSGGVDSQVLLHLLAQLKASHSFDVRAVYIDHGLQIESGQWAQHCAQSCQSFDIPFHNIQVNAKAETGEGPEAAARFARYQALGEFVEENHCLLTAQHLDDQSETFLLQLLRGGGAAGLAAMPFYNPFSKGWHVRPLLELEQEVILNYANRNGLSWVEDPSNKDNQYDRNYLRNQVIPLLKKRWPAIDQTLSRAAKQQAENKKLLETYAKNDLKKLNGNMDGFPVEEFLDFDESRLRNVLRYWIKIQSVPVPSRKVLQQILQQMFSDKLDARSKVSWANYEMYSHKRKLYIISSNHHDEKQEFVWDGRLALELKSLSKKMIMKKSFGAGLRQDIIGKTLRVCFRRGGERIKPAGRKDTHSLKKLFQEMSVPSWERSRVPLIFLGDELIAVVGYCVADQYTTDADKEGYSPVLI